ncbi:MAG TPA: hypothetical protein VH877_09950 [Polyangia bacterium]|jgi:hypothetical protein|nr:hypothetical protein [Polyangia bacterium]
MDGETLVCHVRVKQVEVTAKKRTRGPRTKLVGARLKLVDGLGRSAGVHSFGFADDEDRSVLDAEMPDQLLLQARLPRDEPPYSLELPDGSFLEFANSRRAASVNA